ncbi:hypothetical protein BU25DRAFT_405318 [Macroventuria anomochaeta]|uniref:Uncharacterized protein n=1 Tax=Macroventuria anomochaeta TaxID=301207 RepID=A0ACB6SHF4_9PLEO|nr:uncharacterized protein BU25DRAFT_405318 [Macroventuria anomochaeta]KAF2633423.1 hypothetical protein BU25DRAFT_405318 [Macroventuria anomochaeta]
MKQATDAEYTVYGEYGKYDNYGNYDHYPKGVKEAAKMMGILILFALLTSIPKLTHRQPMQT